MVSLRLPQRFLSLKVIPVQTVLLFPYIYYKKKGGNHPSSKQTKKPKNRYEWFRSDVNLMIIKLIE
mgnify:CR=1